MQGARNWELGAGLVERFQKDERPTSNEKTNWEAGRHGNWELGGGWVEWSPGRRWNGKDCRILLIELTPETKKQS